MEENNLNLNEGVEEVVTPQIDEQVETTTNESSEVVDTQVEKKPVQSAEDNAKYASIRREAEQKAYAKAQDDLIAQQYGKSHGIYTKADYDKAIAQQEREAQIQAEAQKQGISEDWVRRLKDLEDSNRSTLSQKQEYERKLNLINEDAALRKDESFSDYYLEHEADIKESAERYRVDLTTAMLLSIKDNFKAIKDGVTKKVQQETVNNIIKNKTTSTGSVGGGGEQSNSIADMSDADFKKMQERALRGELRHK